MKSEFCSPGDLPTIWYTRKFTDIDAGQWLDYRMAIDQPQELDGELRNSDVVYKTYYFRWQPEPNGNIIQSLRFDKGYSKISPSMIDAFTIAGNFLVISAKFRELLQQFNLGSTLLNEVPIYRSNGKSLSAYPAYCVLHVTETKSALVPEESESIKQFVFAGETEPRPTTPWSEDGIEDMLAVRAHAAEGVDLWADEMMDRRLFFSDRLKRAVDDAGIKCRRLKPIRAKVLA
ncbi:MAG: hypothetical protein AAF409_08685 [Pseudomonadota bacterium]